MISIGYKIDHQMKERILVIGALGQLGTELTESLRERYGRENVIASDIADWSAGVKHSPYIRLDVSNRSQLLEIVRGEEITQIYHLAAVLSAKGESDPQSAWQLNMDGLLNVLQVSVDCGVKKVFWPSSIAVFGPGCQRHNTPQVVAGTPSTVYGISKLSGEYWCQYYFEKYGLDVRSIRYPGLISYRAKPGGGTTDYAVDIFYKAKAGERFQCFLAPYTTLPMMFMEDAVRATLELMDAPANRITVRSSYNLAALSFDPARLVQVIKKVLPSFEVAYAPDFRQQIADSWPASIDDRFARKDWGWAPAFSLEEMVEVMLDKVELSEPSIS